MDTRRGLRPEVSDGVSRNFWEPIPWPSLALGDVLGALMDFFWEAFGPLGSWAGCCFACQILERGRCLRPLRKPIIPRGLCPQTPDTLRGSPLRRPGPANPDGFRPQELKWELDPSQTGAMIYGIPRPGAHPGRLPWPSGRSAHTRTWPWALWPTGGFCTVEAPRVPVGLGLRRFRAKPCKSQGSRSDHYIPKSPEALRPIFYF